MWICVYTVYPRIEPLGLYCFKCLLGGGLFKGVLFKGSSVKGRGLYFFKLKFGCGSHKSDGFSSTSLVIRCKTYNFIFDLHN